MKYTKPVVIAQNKKSGSYAAGCPANSGSLWNPAQCKACERTK